MKSVQTVVMVSFLALSSLVWARSRARRLRNRRPRLCRRLRR